jgi:hypothetical protein
LQPKAYSTKIAAESLDGGSMSTSEISAVSGIPVTETTAPSGAADKPGPWTRFKAAVIRVEKDFAFLKLGILSVLGTLIGLYFQSLSTYQDKVATQAKADLTAATDTFKEAAGTLSSAITLQSLLLYDFVHAKRLNVINDKNALTSKNAQNLYKSYEDAATRLHDSINLMARKVEIDLDWASDIDRDPATAPSLDTDPISTSYLGAVDFDCDKDKPKFVRNDHTTVRTKEGNSLTIDWFSARHHVLTIAYCFDVTHKTWMETIRQWASQSTLDQIEVDKFFSDKIRDRLRDRLDVQVVRLNAFMSLAMSEIDAIRVKYRPTGFYCNLPGVSQGVGLFTKSHNPCTPVRLRD